MIVDLISYLYKTLKMSFKNVFANFGQYACFFAALFIIQTFFATLTVILYNNDNTEWARVQDEYDYHVALHGINEDQKLFLENEQYRNSGSNDDIYDLGYAERGFSYKPHYNAYEHTTKYDVYIRFNGRNQDALDENFDRFFGRHLPALSRVAPEVSVRWEKTPLINFNRNLLLNRFIYIISIIALIVLSVFLLVILYNIRINHYKFIYGIYMSFGADFKKLFETAFWEMFCVSAVTFLPATGVSVLISFLILHIKGIPFACPIWTLLLTTVYGLIVLLASVFFPMRIMATKAPMTLIVAQDNSNLVASPRRSLNLYGSKFPLNYEIYSTWRFRKYNLRLLVSAIVFTSLFICGLYVAEITRVTLANDSAQYEIDLSATGVQYDDLMRDELYSISDAITLVSKSNAVDAIKLNGHIRVRAEYTVPFANLVVPEDIEGYRIANEVQYRTIDEDIISELEKYEYDGDLTSPLRDDNMIIVADAIGNTRRFDYKVGDKIEIATLKERHGAVDSNMSGKALLREQLANYEFTYREFTIGAIIYDIPTLKMPIYLSEASFETVTEQKVNYSHIEVYVDDSLTSGDTLSIEDALNNWGMIYGGVSVVNTHAVHMSHVNEDKQYDEIFTLVAALLLTISPMIWFFSQTLYYFKRENEFTILQSIGALGTEIRRLYIVGGVCMGILAFVFCLGLGYSLSYLLFRFVNVTLPQWTQSYIRYAFYMPWYAIVLSVVMSVACGFLSSFLPYRSFMRRKAKTLAVEYGEVSE